MTDLEKMKLALQSLMPTEEQMERLCDMLGRNQNAGCGGDGSFNAWNFACAMEVVQHLRGALNCMSKFEEGQPSVCWPGDACLCGDETCKG